MKTLRKITGLMLALCLLCGLAISASASTFTDAHGNEIELDDTLEAYTGFVLNGADDAARKNETNLGDLWTDALRWFAVSGRINEYFEEDDVAAGNKEITVDADHIVALWNGGNLKADVAEGKFGAEQLAEVLPYPNTVAVSYLTGAQLLEQLEASSQGLPYSDEEVNGQPFEPESVYAVITSNANAKGGMDASYVFKSVAALEDEKTIVTTAVVRDVIWLYITGELGSMIGEPYAETQSRITLK